MALRFVRAVVIFTTVLCTVYCSPGPDAELPFKDLDLDRHDATQDLKNSVPRSLQDAVVPEKGQSKNLLQKRDWQTDLHMPVHPLSTADEEMLDEIWKKYAQGKESMSLEQLNLLTHDTDQELGEQVVSQSWWQSLLKKLHADPREGLSKQNLKALYLESVGSSIKEDYIRIFVEGAPPAAAVRKTLLQKSNQQLKDKQMLDAIWMKYSQNGKRMHLQQLNLLLRDTDHELGPQIINDAQWQALCKDTGAEPSQGLSKQQLLGLYKQSSGSSIERDYIRIFLEGGVDPAKGKRLGHEEIIAV